MRVFLWWLTSHHSVLPCLLQASRADFWKDSGSMLLCCHRRNGGIWTHWQRVSPLPSPLQPYLERLTYAAAYQQTTSPRPAPRLSPQGPSLCCSYRSGNALHGKLSALKVNSEYAFQFCPPTPKQRAIRHCEEVTSIIIQRDCLVSLWDGKQPLPFPASPSWGVSTVITID